MNPWNFTSIPLLFFHILVLRHRDFTFEHSVAEHFYSTWTTERVSWCGVKSCKALWRNWHSCFRRRVLCLHMNCIAVDWCKLCCHFCRPAVGMRACTATRAASCRNRGFAFSRAASRWGPTTDFLCGNSLKLSTPLILKPIGHDPELFLSTSYPYNLLP